MVKLCPLSRKDRCQNIIGMTIEWIIANKHLYSTQATNLNISPSNDPLSSIFSSNGLDIAMEELQKAARAYYNNASQEVQGLAKELFQLMDTTQDGKISMVEFLEFFKQQDKGMDRSLFQSLDKNGNGQLEFDEFLTCYYIVKQRCLVCDSCKKKLLEMYFTCTTCFDSVADSYNLCVTCYGEKRFQHQHALFLDNHALLASKKVRPTDAYANQEEVPQPAGNGPSKRQQIQGALDKAVQTASSCGVM